MKLNVFFSPDETQGGGDVDVDALLDEIENPVDPNEPDPAAAAPAPVQEYEIQHNGKVIKAPIDKIQTWASQGYNYSQQMAAFNKAKMEWENERKGYEPYKEVDTYARQNPQWWETVKRSFQQVQQGAQNAPQSQNENQDNPLAPLIEPIKSDLDEIKAWKNEIQQARDFAIRQQEDQKLDEEISSVHKEYADIPFDRVDEEGRTLENRILEHAQKIGTKSYKAAFHDYMAPQLQKRAEERGREAAVRARQEQARKGLLGRTQAPTKDAVQPVKNYRNKTYSDIEKEALAEFGIS